MSGKAAKIKCSEKQLALLDQIIKSTRSEGRLVQRAQIIRFAFEGLKNCEISQRVGLNVGQVGIWRRRWQLSFDALIAIECRESRSQLMRSIEDTLSDAPRSGRPPKLSPEQVTQIMAVACEDPANSGRPISLWTRREIANEVVKRQIVPSISKSHVDRLLREASLRPDKVKYWLNTTEKDPEKFQQQVGIVCQTYLDANRLFFQENTYTISVDEMPSLQAKERIGVSKPAMPGCPTLLEYEYIRHGTTCLFGNWDVVNGQLVCPMLSATRNEEDFLVNISNVVATDSGANWVFVVDNLNTHCSEILVRFVAERAGIALETLGIKGKSGILKSMKSRMAFLSSREHRIRFVYLPKHSSWLNQIEIVFGVIQRKVIRHGNFTSVEDLQEKLRQFVEYYNKTFARPFSWTYTGRPNNNTPRPRPTTWRESWVRSSKARQELALAA